MNQRLLVLFAAMISCLMLGQSSWAQLSQDRAQGYLGGQVGLSVPSATGTSARMGFGFTAGAKLSDTLGVGGYFMSSSHNESTGAVNEFDLLVYGLEANYFFDGSGRGAYFGANLGLGKLNVTDNLGFNYSYNPFVWGVQGGYDYKLTSFFSLGGEAQVLFVSGGDAGLVSRHQDAFTTLSFLGQAKIWF